MVHTAVTIATHLGREEGEKGGGGGGREGRRRRRRRKRERREEEEKEENEGVRKLLHHIYYKPVVFMLPTCTSNPASWRSPTSGRLPVMEYGLLSPITSFVASLSFLKAFESRLQAIPWCVCQCVCCSKI